MINPTTLALCFLLVAVPVPLLAQKNATTFQSGAEKQLLAVEDEYVQAEVARDVATLRRLVDDRFVFNRSDGTTYGKEELIRRVLGMRMTGQTLRERSVLMEGDIGLVFGTAAVRTAGADAEESVTTLRYTATYIRRDGSWRMLALQMQLRAKG